MNFQDMWTRFHDKPTDGVLASSNNGYIYTAYKHKLSGILVPDYIKLSRCFELCVVKGKFVQRSPGKVAPPMSRDEILGAASLGLLKPKHLNGWNFSPYAIPKLNLFTLCKQLVPLIKNRGDRNYFWKNNLDQIYRFAFSVNIVDRAFVLKQWGELKLYKPSHLFYTVVAFLDKVKPGEKNGISWLKYGGNKSNMLKEFGADHPFQKM